MPLRYRTLASYGVRSLRHRTALLVRQPQQQQQQQLRFSSSFHRPLHTTSSLQAPASLLIQDDDDEEEDEELQIFAASCLKEIVSKDTAFCTLEDELGDASVWDKPIEDLLEREEDDTESVKQPPGQVSQEMLERFDPENPPETLEDLQLWLECESQQESVLKYQKVIDSARERKDFASLSVVQRQVLAWYQPLKDAIEREQARFMQADDKRAAMNRYGPHMCVLPAEKLAVIVAYESILHCLTNRNATTMGSTLSSTAIKLGQTIETELNVTRLLQQRARDQRKKKNEEEEEYFMETVTESEYPQPEEEDQDMDDEMFTGPDHWTYESHHLERLAEDISTKDYNARKRIMYANRRARKLLEDEEPWSVIDHVQLGVALLEVLMNNTSVGKQQEAAFSYHKTFSNNKLVAWISLHDSIYKMVMEDSFQSTSALSSRHKPMVVQPQPWEGPNKGGYKWLKADLMRTGLSMMQKEALFEADLTTTCDGLNALGSVAWKINKDILDVAQQCWKSGVAIGDIPSKTDFTVPVEPIAPEFVSREDFGDGESDAYDARLKEYLTYKEAKTKYNRIKQKNMDLQSLRCSAILKLDQGEKFKNFEEIFFPYNLDFRGRAYPIPPHLSNVGSDMSRGMLTFAHSKQLGPRGLYWLKVHLANLAGNDKITFDDRAGFTDDHMEDVRAAVTDPFGENRWWMTLDDPFQGLATCHEIVKAIDSGDPESYECSLPVHMDGSCNGLQHYAALGRDRVGGKAVNLCSENKPQDVYSGVMEEVIRRVEEEALVELDFDEESKEDLKKGEKDALRRNRGAKLVRGLIDRGVVKRTVMTSVYGVTFIGARTQIQEKIEEKLEEQGEDIDELENEIYGACNYLAALTMEVMGELFTGARQTMNWLTICARLISQQDQPVAWVSPIGVPVIQPYRQAKPHTIVTLLQSVNVTDRSDDLPIHKARQVSAFPPNYVHSLDSSHMLLTALEMDRRGLVFSAVHDSFWTHPCDVDELNGALRDCFVELYEQPLLEDLKETWELRYPTIQFPDLPERGDLDLNEVRSAPYFFQ